MQDMKPLYWYWFTNLPYIGKKTQQKLLDYFVTPKRVYHEFDENILRNLGITSKGIESTYKYKKERKTHPPLPRKENAGELIQVDISKHQLH